MIEKICPLSLHDIDILKKDFELLTFSNDFIIVYEDQVPCAGIALIEGQVEIFKDSKLLKTVSHGHLLGVYHLFNEYPVKYGCRIKANSKIILLGKSAILALGHNKKLKNHPILKAI